MTIKSIGVVQRGLAIGTTEGVTTTVYAYAAPYGPRTLMAGTSQTATPITLGHVTFRVNENNAGFTVGMRVRASDVADPTEGWVEGVIISESTDDSGQTIVVDSDLITGTGTVSNWKVNLSGAQGVQGPKGDQGLQGPQGLISDPPNDGVRYFRRKYLNVAGWDSADAAFQPLDADLTCLSNLTTVADRIAYYTGPGAAALTTLSGFARTVLDDADAATMRATIGAQPLDADLTSLAGAGATGKAYYRKAADTWVPFTWGSGFTFDTAADTVNVSAGGGNVSNVGTPANDQLAVWTTTNVIEGKADLTWNGSVLGIGGAALNGLQVQTQAAGTPRCFINAFGTDINIALGYSTKGSAAHNFYTGSLARIQVQIIDVATVDTQLQLSGGQGKASIIASPPTAPVEITNAQLVGTPTANTPTAGDNSTKLATTAFVAAALLGAGVTAYSVRGLQGATSATLFSVTFAECVLHNSIGAGVLVKSGSLSVNQTAAIGANGPASALSDGDVSLYAIWGATPGLAGVCSNANPPTGPVLPSGYTHWAYLTTVKRSGGSLLTVYIRGKSIFYPTYTNLGGGGTGDGGWGSVSAGGVVPAIAQSIQVFATATVITNNNGGGGLVWNIGAVNGGAMLTSRLDCYLANFVISDGVSGVLPNVGQAIWFAYSSLYGLANISSNNLSVCVYGYDVPNES